MPKGGQMLDMLKGRPLLPQETDGGFWRTDHTFSSTLMLKNILYNMPITATPILYMADGTEYDLTPVNLDPAGVAVLNINNALQNAPSNILPHVSTFGSAGIRFQWLWAGAVTASVRSGDDVRSLVYLTHANADVIKVNDPAAIQSAQTLEGMWWKQEPGISGFLSLTNTSSNTIEANLQVFNSVGSGAQTINQTVALAPHCTNMVDLAGMWTQLPSAILQGGVRVSYTGPTNAIAAEGGLEDGGVGYSHALRLASFPAPPPTSLVPFIRIPPGGTPPNTSTGNSSQSSTPSLAPPETINLDSTGIMIGTQDPNMQFPQGTQFVPYLVFRNMTEAPLPIDLTAVYSHGATPTNISLGTATLPAQAIQQVDLTALLTAAGLGSYNGYLNLRTSFTGHGTDIMEESGSLDQTNSYVFDVPPVREGPSRGKITSYWNASGDTDTMVSLWNYSAKDENLVLTLYYQAGQYKLPVHLAANASVTLSIASLIKSGAPDANGNTIPITAVQGSSKLTGASGTDMDIIDVAMHGAIFNVRTGTCTCYCAYCNYVTFICPNGTNCAITEGIGDVTEECPYVVLYDCCCCNLEGQVDWDTSGGDSSVATIDGSGNITGQGGGATLFSGTSRQSFSSVTSPDCIGFTAGGFCDFYEYPTFSAGVNVNSPSISDLSIYLGAVGDTVTVTINGSGFGTGSSSRAVASISGIDTTVTSSDNTQVVASFRISPSDAGGGQGCFHYRDWTRRDHPDYEQFTDFLHSGADIADCPNRRRDGSIISLPAPITSRSNVWNRDCD
jgi:hypothetical protein